MDLEKELAGRPVKVPVNFNADKGALDIERLLAKKPIKVPVEFDTHPMLGAFQVAARDIGGLFTDAFNGIRSAGASLFSGFSRDGLAAVTGVGEGAKTMAEAFSSVGLNAGSAATSILKFAGYGTLIAEAGAGITAAWGAASTAIAAVPAAIGLIAAPIAAVVVGMDGIKRAAKSIEPAFNSLKASISATFEKGLTPVFKNLATNLFPTLQTGLNGIANAMVGVTANVGTFLTQGPQLAQISTIFSNVQAAIGRVDLQPMITGFLSLAGNKAALDLLVTSVNGLGTALQSISQNTALTGAFDGLKGVVTSLEKAFTDLVNNGITLFKEAAPGAQAAIDGIGSFLGKFNWQQLGGAVGSALRGIGSALGSIPQSTVDAVSASFDKLGAALNSPAFQQAVGTWASWTASIIGYLADLITHISNTVNEIERLNQAVKNGPNSPFKAGNASDAGAIESLKNDIRNNAPGVEAELAKLPPAVAKHLRDTVAAENAGAQQVAAAAAGGGKAAANAYVGGLAAVQPQQRGILSALPGFAQTDLAPLPGLFADKANAARLGFGTGLRNLSADQAAALGVLPGQAQTQLAPLATTAQASVQAMAAAVDASIPGLGTAFATGFTNLGPLVDTAFQALSATNVTAGMTTLGTAVTAAFPAAIAPAFTLGFAALGPAFISAFTALSATAVTPGMTALGTAITAAFPAVIAPAFTLGFAGLGPAFISAFTALAATGVTPGMQAIAQAITAGFGVVQQAITAGFTQAQAAFTQGFATLNQTATDGFTKMNEATTQAMTKFDQAIKTGMDQAVQAVQEAANSIVQALNQAAGQAGTAGTNLGKAFVSGIRSQISAARQAGADLGAAAVEGLNSTKGIKSASPSRYGIQAGEYLGLGFIGGMDRQMDAVTAQAASMGAAAVAAIQDEVGVLSQLQLGVANASSFADAVSAKVSAIVAESGASATAPVAMFSHKTVLDGKTVEESVGKVVGEWAKDVNTLVKVA